MNRRAQPWLGTLVDISAEGSHQAIDAAFAAVALVHRLMSFHDPASDLSRLNRALPGATVTVDAHTWQVLDLAEQVRIASDGLFNAACAPQLVAWACLPPPGAGHPADSAAGPPVFQPGLAVYQCDVGHMVRKLAPGWIDLGGIAKGYAVDLAIQVLSEAGVRHACVNAGGDLRVLGEQAWPVAVRDPAQPQRAHTQLWLRNEAMATSAGYFSAHRLVDGRSGAALADGRSVSVRAPLCAVADALTKVVMASDNPEHPALTRWAATSFIL